MDCSFDHSGFLVDARHHHDSSGIKQGRSDLFLESAFELVCFRYRFLGFCYCCIVLDYLWIFSKMVIMGSSWMYKWLERSSCFLVMTVELLMLP